MASWQTKIKFRSSIRDTDKGYADLIKRLNELRKCDVFVGITEEAGLHEKATKDAKRPVMVLEVATWNEYGLGVPERPFMRGWFDSTRAKNADTIRIVWQEVIARRITPAVGAERIGQQFQKEAQDYLETGPFTPLAPSTVQRKGHSTPLIETGQMRASLTYRIVVGGKSFADYAAEKFRE